MQEAHQITQDNIKGIYSAIISILELIDQGNDPRKFSPGQFALLLGSTLNTLEYSYGVELTCEQLLDILNDLRPL